MPTHVIARMAVEIEGEGDAVLCLHGLGGTSNTFTPNLPSLGAFRLIRPDLPGSGRSALPAAPLSLRSLIEAVAQLCAALDLRRIHLLAHSLGTLVAQQLALEQPQLVRSLVLLGALTEPPDPARVALRQRAAAARAEGMADIADAVAAGSLAAATRRDHPLATAFVRESLMRQPPDGYAATCEALAGAKAADVRGLRRPTLLLTGADDGVAPPSMARALAERIEGGRAEILSRCGHWPGIERTGEVNAALIPFYAREAR